VLSGRALFSYDPSLFVDDEGAAGDDEYVLREEEGETDHAADEGIRVTFVCAVCSVSSLPLCRQATKLHGKSRISR
jgi:hypothetical protein